MRVKRLTDTMKNLKKLQQAEINEHHDNTCMVCFQEMTEATLLPCKHFFHDECLRQWIVKNANNFCPKCKKQFNFQAKKDTKTQEQRNQEDDRAIERARAERIRREMEIKKQTFQNQLQKAIQNRTNKTGLEKEDQNLSNSVNEHIIQKKKVHARKQMEEKIMEEKQEKPERRMKQQSFDQNIPKIQEENFASKQHAAKVEQQTYRRMTQEKDVQQKEGFEKHVNNGGIWFSMPTMMPLDTPAQIIQQKRHTALRAGSLAFGMPTQAVYNRTFKHMFVRQKYEKANKRLVEDFSGRQYQQMMLFADT